MAIACYVDLARDSSVRRPYKILVPEIMANTVSRQHAKKLIELFYKFSDKFPDNQKGRDLGYAFMSHWLEGYQKSGCWIGERL